MGNDLYRAVKRQIDRSTIPLLQECFKEAVENVRDSWIDDLESMYKSVAEDFYASYEPKRYARKENNNLYDVFVVERDKRGKPQGIDFNPNVMEYRSGYSGEDGLYETVFKQGYHGGATGDHPSPDTFWWRKPPRFRFWYKKAEQAEISPYDDMIGRIERYFDRQAIETAGKIEDEMFRLLSERIS